MGLQHEQTEHGCWRCPDDKALRLRELQRQTSAMYLTARVYWEYCDGRGPFPLALDLAIEVQRDAAMLSWLERRMRGAQDPEPEPQWVASGDVLETAKALAGLKEGWA